MNWFKLEGSIGNWLYYGMSNDVCPWSPVKHFKRASARRGCRAGRLKQRSVSVLSGVDVYQRSTKENWGMCTESPFRRH